MTHGSLFSGIGGFDLAAEWMGWENKFHCEWNEFGKKVLNYYWPNAESFHDITKTDFTKYAGTIDIISGGFPCQPYSTAGLRKGKEDERHLWPQMLRTIQEVKPRWVVGENVRGLVSWGGGLVFHEVQSDLEAEGYEVQPFLLPAASVNAPHRRDRVWFVAYAHDKGRSSGLREVQEKNGEISEWNNNAEFCNSSNDDDKKWINVENPNSFRQKRRLHEGESKNANGEQFSKSNAWFIQPSSWDNFPIEFPLRFRDDGFPYRLDSITIPKWRTESIKAGGNAIVPQVALQIFKAIEEYEKRFGSSAKCSE